MEADRNEQRKKYAKLIANAWSDEAFKERLIADPKAVLAAEGLIVPDDAEVKVIEQKQKQYYLIIPMRPEDVTLEMVDERAAAACGCCVYGCCI